LIDSKRNIAENKSNDGNIGTLRSHGSTLPYTQTSEADNLTQS
jgi:hypothetical protein